MKIICVGKIKEQALKEDIKRLKKNIEIIEIPDEKCPENYSDKEKENVKITEGKKILKHIKNNDYVISLAIEGKLISTEKLKDKLNDNVVFIIGGSLGLSDEVIKRSDYLLSFSRMTFPHQLMRWILIKYLNEVL